MCPQFPEYFYGYFIVCVLRNSLLKSEKKKITFVDNNLWTFKSSNKSEWTKQLILAEEKKKKKKSDNNHSKYPHHLKKEKEKNIKYSTIDLY